MGRSLIKRNHSVKSWSQPLRKMSGVSVLILLASACSSTGETTAFSGEFSEKGDELLVVDCLLPGEVRTLTSNIRHVTSKRPVKTTGEECADRGGEFTAFDRADYKTALKVWMQQAVEGDAVAQNYVGEIYEKGLGVPPDFVTAKKWYERAAEQKNTNAYINLANLYEKGLGVDKDPILAMNLYRRASGIDWDDLSYASTLVSSQQVQSSIADKQEEIALLEQEQTVLEASLQETRQLIAQEAESAVQAQPEPVEALATDLPQPAESVAQAAGPPEILIFDPAITLSGDKASAVLEDQAEFVNVVGKISSGSGLREAYLNGELLETDDFDLFFTILPVASLPKSVKIFAEDQQQNSVEFDFTLQSTSADMVAKYQPADVPESLLGHYHALIIGNSDYNNFPGYQNGADNALQVKNLLEERYGFNSKMLLNATRYQVLFAIDQMRQNLKAEDNLLVYFAGHCGVGNNRQGAYWLPVDAESEDSSRWISNRSVSDLLNTFESRRIMVVSDSCYDGTFTTAAIARSALPSGSVGYQQWMKSMKDVRARTVLTNVASDRNLTLADGGQSVFTQTFLEVLKKNNQVIDGNSLYVEMLKTINQAEAGSLASAPVYEAIKYAGHETGEFFFRPLI